MTSRWWEGVSLADMFTAHAREVERVRQLQQVMRKGISATTYITPTAPPYEIEEPSSYIPSGLAEKPDIHLRERIDRIHRALYFGIDFVTPPAPRAKAPLPYPQLPPITDAYEQELRLQAKRAWTSACDKLINEGETE